MTNADTINRDLHEMEGRKQARECLHPNYCIDYAADCLEGDDDAWDCEHLAQGKIWEVCPYNHLGKIPNYLSDGAYILGLEKKLIRAGCYVYFNENYNKYFVARRIDDDNEEAIGIDEYLEHAIALAAIQRWKESGG